TPFSGNFALMADDAVKVQHGRFHLFAPADDAAAPNFPYTQLTAYEAQEVAAGRPPIFVTATYQGRSRPVYFAWSLGLSGTLPTTPQKTWMRAVNVSDPRFLTFWITQYVQAVLIPHRTTAGDWWVGLDECAFMWALYGVID